MNNDVRVHDCVLASWSRGRRSDDTEAGDLLLRYLIRFYLHPGNLTFLDSSCFISARFWIFAIIDAPFLLKLTNDMYQRINQINFYIATFSISKNIF